MQTEKYRGYTLWGHAILQQEGIPQPAKFAGSGTVTRDTTVVEVSGVLGAFDTDEEAELVGLSWCRAWVDSHG
ncbi:hypothetical protein [Paraburkholderia kirstenboschensis]|uniref:Transposase n=1 Tax=Paraburkholderia kirstenboschensis TaxID=1245436 RepID=A0ABZ0EIP2_9BURK|nr:hypothetical protein [Paraburkholderia kirstenboschensis]WOD17066.1 hypothetical protein RW095_14625 [Paraburkholderia kirstenboschensis]